MTMDLITPQCRTDFREFCVAYLLVYQINELFTRADIPRSRLPPDPQLRGERRPLVERYYASLNWQTPTDVAKFLRVIEYALTQRYLSAAPPKVLRALCEREGLVVAGSHVERPACSALRPP